MSSLIEIFRVRRVLGGQGRIISDWSHSDHITEQGMGVGETNKETGSGFDEIFSVFFLERITWMVKAEYINPPFSLFYFYWQ